MKEIIVLYILIKCPACWNSPNPQDYGLPKVNKFPQNPQNVSNPNKMFQTNYRNSKNYFKPIIINSSPFRRSNEKLKNDKKNMFKEGTFLEQTPTQNSGIPSSQKEENSSIIKPPSGFIPYQHKEEGNTNFNQENLCSMEKDVNIENMEGKIGSDKSKLFHVLKILKDSKNDNNKYKRYSMNNFDELKKQELAEKDSDETVGEDLSANFITFQKLNKNLCKGI